jgi:SAM-dependent methyltransferase
MLNASESRKAWDRLAGCYEDEVISPIHNAKGSPVITIINAIQGKAEKTVADLGCGTGPLLPFLLKNFKSVMAMDFSGKMIETANQRIQTECPQWAQKITLLQRSLVDFNMKNDFDVVLSVNSLLMADPDEIGVSFANIRRSLKDDGLFIGVFPSFESILEEYRHTYWREHRARGSHGMARAAANRKLEAKRIDFELGTYDTGDMIQKYYLRHELEFFMESAKLMPFSFQKVCYRKEHSFNYHDDLAGHPRMWDWVVLAKK